MKQCIREAMLDELLNKIDEGFSIKGNCVCWGHSEIIFKKDASLFQSLYSYYLNKTYWGSLMYSIMFKTPFQMKDDFKYNELIRPYIDNKVFYSMRDSRFVLSDIGSDSWITLTCRKDKTIEIPFFTMAKLEAYLYQIEGELRFWNWIPNRGLVSKIENKLVDIDINNMEIVSNWIYLDEQLHGWNTVRI